MERLVIVAVVGLVAVLVAVVLQRRTPPTGAVKTGYNVPAQLERADFPRPDAEWLVVVFTAASCSTCAGVVAKAQALASDSVVVEEVEVGASPERHDRYGIDGVPTTVVADVEGVVRASFLGPVTAADLWAAVASVRD